MFTNWFTSMTALVAAISVGSIGGLSRPAYAHQCCPSHGSPQHGGGHGGHGGHEHGSGGGAAAAHSADTHEGHEHGAGGADHSDHAQAAPRPPRGGQLTNMNALVFEVVYRPREVRLYAYDPALRPASVEGVRGEMAMQVEGHSELHRAALHHVAPPPDSRQQDYLAAGVNLSKIRDGGMRVWFKLDELPRADGQPVVFHQVFALSKPQVTAAALTGADRAGIARQRVCPVMGGALGSMGEPVKLLVDNHPLYLCCRGCVRKVQEAPDDYLAKARPAQGGH